MSNKKPHMQIETAASEQAIAGARMLDRLRALVVVRNPLEREAICTLLGGWGCEVHAAAAAAEIEPGTPPDFVIVGAAEQTETAGVAELSAVNITYAACLPAIVIGEASLPPAGSGRVYAVLEPMFSPWRLREALTQLLRGKHNHA